jgi:iron complex transport system substrate-binding protein
MRGYCPVILKRLSVLVFSCLALQSVRVPCQAQEQHDQAALSGISLPAARIVSLAPNITETLAVIGAADQVVGYSFFCKSQVKFPPRPIAGSFNQPNHDAIRSLKPDVVLFSEHAKPEDLKQLEAAGFQYLILPASNIGDIVSNVRLLGTLTGRTAKASEVAGEIERIVGAARVLSKSSDPGKRPRVFLEVDGPDPLYTAGAGSFISEMVYLAGGINVFADRTESYPLVTPAAVIKADPEYIFVGGFNKSADDIRNRPGWDRISAVKSGKVRTGTWELWLLLWRPGPSVGVTIQKLARELGTTPAD